MKLKNGIIWLETISIRTAGVIEASKVFDICARSFQSIAVEKLLKLTVYRSAIYATDISIHLQWESDPGPMSILGSEVSSALGDLGLINHTLWIEQEVVAGCGSEMSSSKKAIDMKTS
jgi:hypothetical protein